MKVYLEVGRKRTFACAVDWPGWCRSGKTEDAALEALVDYGPRYAKALGRLAGNLEMPTKASSLEVMERVEGNATTEFGAPGVVPELDRKPMPTAELERVIGIVQAAWRAFDDAADSAKGKALAPAGPRGGGRALGAMIDHVRGADAGYTNAVGGKVAGGEHAEWPAIQDAFVEVVRARARGELPDRGPRGGRRWPAPYAIRRSAWHALDHAWEIEDRAQGGAAPRSGAG